MTDGFEIDFMNVDSAKSGDAIAMRFTINGTTNIHVIDGGFQSFGEKFCEYIDEYYGSPGFIDRVVVTHPDRDHAGGVREVIQHFDVGEIWMLRPWLYLDELLPRFARFTSKDNLEKRLRELYPNISAIEEIADERGIHIFEPFTGEDIGPFKVLSPSLPRYLDLVVNSDKTPESTKDEAAEILKGIESLLAGTVSKVVNYIKALWGEEVFSNENTSSENEMSVIQYASIGDKTIMFTGDAGRIALTDAINNAPAYGIVFPGVDKFQVPHHGSRRNVSTEILDNILGPRIVSQAPIAFFNAYISASKSDKDHPRKSVVRAMFHRGGSVHNNEIGNIRTSHNYPDRRGWTASPVIPYPNENES